MPGPFPGMDPYFEAPAWWRGFHTRFIVFCETALQANLPDGFVAENEERVYVSAAPRSVYPDIAIFATAPARPPRDTGIGGRTAVATRTENIVAPEVITVEEHRERFVQIIDQRGAEPRVVTVIELLSPTNKESRHNGRQSYVQKRDSLIDDRINLLEIDLLRGGEHTVRVPREWAQVYGTWDYLLSLYDGSVPGNFLFWRIALQGRLPGIELPLSEDVDAVVLDLQAVLDRCYDEGGAARKIDYAQETIPPLTPEQSAWADALLRDKGYRV